MKPDLKPFQLYAGTQEFLMPFKDGNLTPTQVAEVLVSYEKLLRHAVRAIKETIPELEDIDLQVDIIFIGAKEGSFWEKVALSISGMSEEQFHEKLKEIGEKYNLDNVMGNSTAISALLIIALCGGALTLTKCAADTVTSVATAAHAVAPATPTAAALVPGNKDGVGAINISNIHDSQIVVGSTLLGVSPDVYERSLKNAAARRGVSTLSSKIAGATRGAGIEITPENSAVVRLDPQEISKMVFAEEDDEPRVTHQDVENAEVEIRSIDLDKRDKLVGLIKGYSPRRVRISVDTPAKMAIQTRNSFQFNANMRLFWVTDDLGNKTLDHAEILTVKN